MVWPNLTDGKIRTINHTPQAGSVGEVNFHPCDLEDFAAHISAFDDHWLAMRLTEAHNDFLDREFVAAKNGYLLISKVLELKSLSDTPAYTVCQASLEKLELAQNFFGYSPNYVPILDRDLLKKRAEASVSVVQEVYRNILQARQMGLQERVAEELRDATRLSILAMQSDSQREIDIQELRIQKYNSEIDIEKKRKEYIDKEIEKVWGQKDRLMKLESGESFDFFDFVAGAASIYMGGEKLYAASKATDTIFSLGFIEDNESHLKKIADGFKSVGSSGVLSLLGGSKKKVYSELDLFPLDQAIRELTIDSFESAQRIAAARFSIMESEVVTLYRKSFIQDLNAVLDRMNAIDLRNMTEVSSRAFFTSAEHILEGALKEAQQFLFLYARAQTFWSHKDVEKHVDYTIFDPSQLLLEIERLRNQEVLAYEDTVGRYHQDLQPLEIRINKHLGKKISDALAESNKINIELGRALMPPNEFDHRVITVALELPNLKSNNGEVGIYIEKLSESIVYLDNDRDIGYRHAPIRLYHKYDIRNWERINKDVEHNALTDIPIHSSWTLEIEKEFWKDADFSNVEELILRVFVKYRT